MSINDRAVRVMSRIPSVFHRLIISYIVLVFLVAASVSGLSYFYFKTVFNKELYNFHRLYLVNIEKELSGKVVDSSKLIYMELGSLLSQGSSDLFSAGDRLPLNASKIYSSYRILDDLVARNYDRIDAIHLYYVQSGLLISSSGFQSGEASTLRGDGAEWLQSLRATDEKSLWTIFDRPAYFGMPAMTLLRSLRCFPILSGPEDCSILVCVDFRTEAIRGIMARLLPGDGGKTALMPASGAGPYIAPDADGDWDEATATALRRIVTGGESAAGAIIRLPSGPRLVSVLPLSDSGWDLVNVVPAKQVYRRGEVIRYVILAICVAAIGLGALAAAFAASGIYNPLRHLFGRFRSLPGVELPDLAYRTDEYRAMDVALSGLSTRMEALEATIEANRPIIRHDLVLRLLEGEPMDPEELEEAFDLAGVGSRPAGMRASILYVSAGETGSGDRSSREDMILKYRVADELGRAEQGFALASALAADRVGLITEAVAGETVDADRLGQRVTLVAERIGARVRIASGPAVSSLDKLRGSFAEASELASYFFIFPELNCLRDRPDLLARTGHTAMPERGFTEALAASLEARDPQRFRSLLEAYRSSARDGECRAVACRAELEDLGFVVADFARSLRLKDYADLGRSLSELLAEARSIDTCLQELASVAAEVCAGAEDPRKRSASLSDRVKAYVADHLGEELSLDRVGDAVAVSPGYLGKVFKQETGRTFVSYLNEARLGEAARLLVETREPIQEIARLAGFNTPAYFIRLFKGRYGSTPLDYRRMRAGDRPG